MAKDRCPCNPERAYSECCRPFHRGQVEPPTPEALMRSRFSAFAKKEVEYLWKTLDAEHVDRLRAFSEVVRELREACQKFQYVRLDILETEDLAAHSSVRFRAHVFEKGKDRSFEENSLFRRDAQGWRYWHGAPQEPEKT